MMRHNNYLKWEKLTENLQKQVKILNQVDLMLYLELILKLETLKIHPKHFHQCLT